MAKKKIRKDYHVVVRPEISNYHNSNVEQSFCLKIQEQIRRHVDGVEQCYIGYTEQTICEFCKSGWEEDENGQPLCCNRAIEEWDKLHKTNKEADHD